MNFEKLFINGEWIDGASGNFIEVLDVGTKAVMARVPRGNEEDVNLAVSAALKAQEAWQEKTPEERIAYVQKALDYLRAHQDEITDIEISELGQPYDWTHQTHVLRNFSRIESYLEVAKNFQYERGTRESTLRYEPVGVVACLTPWNYPLGQVVQKVIPALLGGNTIVLKPSQHTPLTVYYMLEAFQQAGLPKGVFNLVTGAGSEVGHYLTLHKDVTMVSFTGSTSAGRQVGRESLSTIKKFSLELGGKSPALFLPHADYDKYLPMVAQSCFSNSGQTCAAYTRLVVPESDYTEVIGKLAPIAQTWQAGLPRDEGTKLGPLINHQAFLKVKGYIEKGLADGAQLLFGNIPVDDGKDIIGPTIFGKVTPEMSIVRDEIFGPVLVIQTYTTLEEGICLANDTNYGLAAAIFGAPEEAIAASKRLKAGQVYLNSGARDIMAPFGGYKESGLGREGGPMGFEEFLEVKAVFID